MGLRIALAVAAVLALPAQASALSLGEKLEAMSGHAQSFQLWIKARYPRPPVQKENLIDLPRPDVQVRCGRAGCRDQLAPLFDLFRESKELPTCRGFPSYVALRLLDGRGAPVGVIYITSARPTVFEYEGVCYDTPKELDFDGGNVFDGLFRWVD